MLWSNARLSLAGRPVEIHFTEKRKTLPSLDQEIPFSFEELFFSRTDARGVILSGNGVFQRISMYSWDELINKPHSLIRHPDMPRAVFWLLWETIKKGEPIGAYVKNRAKDGRYYWVFAIVTPIEAGYLSVRLKPSAMLSIVDGEYKSLVAAAIKDKLSPQESAALLLERLAQLGFPDYAAFMAAALSKELAARAQHLRREPDHMIACFDELVAAANSLLDQAGAIFDAYARNRYIPLNLRVQAAQLGDAGVTIGAISSNYNAISATVKNNMSQFIASAQQVLTTINNGLFLLGVAKVQREVAEFFAAETSSSTPSHQQEMLSLQQQQRAYQRKAVEGLHAITEQAGRFQQDFTEMKRLSASLEVTRVMGKMESSRLDVARDGLDELIDDLETFQTAIADGLRKIEHLNWSIRSNAGRLLEIMAS